MQTIQYRLDTFEGPLDLLLALISKNKVNIEDIPISLICEQYLDYLRQAQEMDMEIASEFIVMASELMLIKSRMLLPRPTEEAEDPRKVLTDALIRYQQAKAAAVRLAEQYVIYSGRMVKDTDEISVDKTFVADQDVSSLKAAVKRIRSYMDAIEDARAHAFTPMISKRVVSVEVKIAGMLTKMRKSGSATLDELIGDETSLPDLIAAFVGVLELVKVRRLLIDESAEDYSVDALHGLDTKFILNTDESTILTDEISIGDSY
ncbi:MAG: segregation/condensation protein A [Clostridia bacterium]|nr:segregation/condensation protein A [Clostridia bacterium]